MLSRLNGMAKWLLVVLALPVVLWGTGCVCPVPAGTLPHGRWRGEGQLVYERWNTASEPPSPGERGTPDSVHRQYATWLEIRPGELDGHAVILLEIMSDRGSLPDLGDQTHLQAALIKAKCVSPQTSLYRLVGLLVNPKENEQLSYHDTDSVYAASCSSTAGMTVFQIHYADDFTDVFRFQGRQLEKAGMFVDTNSGLIHWTERLTQQADADR